MLDIQPTDILNHICSFLFLEDVCRVFMLSKVLWMKRYIFTLKISLRTLRIRDHLLFIQTAPKEWLQRIHTLDLSCTIVEDVSALGNVHTLNLSWTNVKDVSALGNVHTLDLSYTHVKDVSALGKVHTLDLRFCENVEDISMLGNVHTLDVSALGKVHTLDLRDCHFSMSANWKVPF